MARLSDSITYGDHAITGDVIIGGELKVKDVIIDPQHVLNGQSAFTRLDIGTTPATARTALQLSAVATSVMQQTTGTSTVNPMSQKSITDLLNAMEAAVILESRIPVLTAAKIPALDASKITTGTLAADRIPTLNQNTTGSAGSAAVLITARSISATGDATWTTTFNGSANVTGVMTLSTSGVTAGTYAKTTVDAKGRVTAGAALVAADIPVLDGSKITTGTIAAARIPTLNQSTTGSAATAASLTTARSIAMTGDGTWTTTFNGAANVTGVMTLTDSGTSVGTFAKVTVDAKGRVTAGSSLSVTDIPNLDVSKIATGVFSLDFIPSIPTSKITGLGTAASKNVGTGTGNLLEVGAGGILKSQDLRSLTDVKGPPSDYWSKGTRFGFISSLAANMGGDTTTYGVLMASGQYQDVSGAAGAANKLFLGANQILYSYQISATTWSPTLSIFHSGNLSGSTGTSVYEVMSQKAVTDALNSISASQVTSGTFAEVRIPVLTAAKIPVLDAGKITTGAFAEARIPVLTAAKIPVLDASKISTGVLAAARIPTLNQNTTGSAGSAATLATARSISATGDATWTTSFNGAANATGVLTLTASGVTAGTYAKTTVDTKGRVTAGAALVAADIPALDAGKITTGSIAAARLPVAQVPSLSTALTTQDLNTVTVAGFYHQASNANATALRNYPVVQAGSLEVMNSAGTSQRYTTYGSDGSNIYTRGLYSSVWGDWIRVIKQNDVGNIAASEMFISTTAPIDSVGKEGDLWGVIL